MIQSAIYKGLSEQEVEVRLAKDGPNELPSSKPRNFFAISYEVLKEPMFLLLVLCCLLYLILGDLEEALTLSVFVVVVIGITLFQSWKTEKTISALKDLSSPKSLVVRNGQEIYISSRDLVVDDILILNEGDKISADAIVLDAINLMIDESSLTGESLSVAKNNQDASPKPNEEVSSRVYSGTLVTQGRAYCKVTAIGTNTELGKIGKALKSIDNNDDSLLQKELSRIVGKIIIIAGILFLIIISILALRQGFIQGLLSSLTFAIAMLPEEIPAVLTIFMAIGAWRIAQKKVLTRKMSSIETLGSITVLCTDKTGTITENKMVVSELYIKGEIYKINIEDLAGECRSLIEFAFLASRENSFDPMEKALQQIVSSLGPEYIHKDWKMIQEYPLSKDLLAMSRAWDLPDTKEEFALYSKGAPEAIFDLCHLSIDQLKSLTVVVEDMASRGLRVLGVAKSKSKLERLPKSQHDVDFEFCGLIGFFDPIRNGVKGAVRDCYSAGIKVIMITGDYHVTAQNIAKEIGLKDCDKYIIGSELATLTDGELGDRIKDTSIFSRVAPEQKLRIVEALKRNQEIIAMTGDGVNDAPALKASHVGIAMGARGTDVARESADLVLLDDNFSSIVSAIRLGRRVYENLSNALSYIVSIHVPIAGLTLIPVIFADLPIIFFPVHVAFLELVIDPTCSIVFEVEPAAKNIMNRPPRQIHEAILSNKRLTVSLLQGLGVFLLVLVIYFLALGLNKTDGEVRMFSFMALLIGNFLLTIAGRSWKNKAFWIIVTLVTVASAVVLYTPALKRLFHFV